MKGLMMVAVALAIVVVVTADGQTTKSTRKGGEGKSAQRVFTTRPADFGDDNDNNIVFGRDRNRDRNDRRHFGLGGGSSSFVTPNPTRVVTVSTSPGLSVSPGFGRDQIILGGDDRFNQIYSPGSIFPGHALGGGFPGAIHGGNHLIGGNTLGGGLGHQSTDRYGRYLELLVARDPTVLLQNPELLIQYPELILIRPEILSQYPELRQYIDPRILNLASSVFNLNSQQVPFRRVFPQNILPNPGNFAGNIGSNFVDSARFGGFGGLSGVRPGLDFQRPIDVRGGGLNRPILTTISPPLNFGTINPNRNIRFSKK